MPTTITISVTGMHCGSCSLLIDDTLEDLPGVLTSTTSRKMGETTVDLDPTRTTADDVITTITELGYPATLAP
ncbi:heavy-metal-associated domain-containing protein [Tsukamurella sputi]|uniref:Heavy-metal-associated domain-containing protein n=1 Tax=Tsukamurella sputi TaxID=2591848 RepID=A0A5C5RMH1_9ACTN|nr:heavy metal-associated domain-containing protein [Tsukamurella sputi]TWS24146.1 heavy-metal-associated domain-containing protein [Tsukamurella sputi]